MNTNKKSTAILRGMRKRCPNCGEGRLFKKWTQINDYCPACHIKLLENYGDPWAFLLFIDRALFVFPLIVGLYFGLHKYSLALFTGLSVVLVIFFILTTQNRYGCCVALDYLTRRKSEDVSGEKS